ncbi:hypothetical protein MRB53_037459 [Persea americana]|nr:hypothetical protein MRB53_037459 [Persea americana]
MSIDITECSRITISNLSQPLFQQSNQTIRDAACLLRSIRVMKLSKFETTAKVAVVDTSTEFVHLSRSVIAMIRSHYISPDLEVSRTTTQTAKASGDVTQQDQSTIRDLHHFMVATTSWSCGYNQGLKNSNHKLWMLSTNLQQRHSIMRYSLRSVLLHTGHRLSSLEIADLQQEDLTHMSIYIMLSSSFVTRSLSSSLLATATPSAPPDPCPTNQNYENCIRQYNADPSHLPPFCYILRKAVLNHDNTVSYVTQPGDGAQECFKQCTAIHGSQKDVSISCALPPGESPSWVNNVTLGPGMQSAMLPCNCDDKTTGAFADAFIHALPHLADVDTTIDSIETAIQSVKSIGDLTQNHKDIFQTAASIQHAIADMDKGKDAFGKWVASKVCPAGQLSEDQTNEIFKTVYDINQLIAAVATLPDGGAVLSSFRLAGDAPKLIDGDSILSSLPKEWTGPKTKPDNPIKPKPKDEKPTKPTKASDPAGKPTSRLDDKPTSNGKPNDSQKQTTPTSTPHEQSSNKATDSKTSTPASTTSEKQTSSAKSTSSTTATSSGKSSSQSQTSTSSSQQSGSSSSQSHSSTSTSQSSSSSSHSGSSSSQQSSSSSASSSSSSPSSSGSSGGIHKTIVQSSVSAIQTVTKTCEAAKYPQACAHYYSASMINPSASKFTCPDNHKPATTIGPAGINWDGQHQNKKFASYVKTQYQDPADKSNKPLECQRCQWPPADLLSNGDKQQVRNLPGRENSDTNDMWKDFCMLHDGGKDNGQRLGNQVVSLDEELFCTQSSSCQDKSTSHNHICCRQRQNHNIRDNL